MTSCAYCSCSHQTTPRSKSLLLHGNHCGRKSQVDNSPNEIPTRHPVSPHYPNRRKPRQARPRDFRRPPTLLLLWVYSPSFSPLPISNFRKLLINSKRIFAVARNALETPERSASVHHSSAGPRRKRSATVTPQRDRTRLVCRVFGHHGWGAGSNRGHTAELQSTPVRVPGFVAHPPDRVSTEPGLGAKRPVARPETLQLVTAHHIVYLANPAVGTRTLYVSFFARPELIPPTRACARMAVAELTRD